VKRLIVFMQISFTAIWVVLKAIDIYTEKADGSVKPVSLAIAGQMRKTEQNPQSRIKRFDPLQGKKQAMTEVCSGFESIGIKPRASPYMVKFWRPGNCMERLTDIPKEEIRNPGFEGLALSWG